MDDMELYGEEEFDLAEYVHDEDSDHPIAFSDTEPELEYEEQYIREIIQETLSELENAVNTQPIPEQVTLDSGTVLKALQLLKAYTAMYDITYEDYNYDYD